jgi:uncharacterized membrane protein YoaK (UPF0700 family)
MADATPRPVVGALLALTFATGIIDIASVLGPGRVFCANMTGNVFLLGVAVTGAGPSPLAMGLLALGGFVIGATIGGRLTKSADLADARRGFGVEIAQMGLAGTAAFGGAPIGVVIFFLGAAMGTRNAVVRKLAVPDLTTTVLTLTVTGLAADSSLAGGTNPRWTRRLLSILALFGGGAVGALVLRAGLPWVIAVALAVDVAAVTVLTSRPAPPPAR